MTTRRLLHSQLPTHAEYRWTMITIAPAIAAIGLAWYAATNGMRWLIALAVMLGAGGTYVAWKAYERACARQPELDVARAEAIKQQGFGGNERIAFKRHVPIVTLSLLILGVIVIVGASWKLRTTAFAWITLGAAVPLAALGGVILQFSRRSVLELSSDGVRVEGHEIPWRAIGNILRGFERRREAPYLRLVLDEPLPPQTLARRLRSWLSRGESDREVFVSLAHASDSSFVIYDVALALWARMGGPDEPPAPRIEEEARRVTVLEAATALVLAGLFVYGLEVDFIASPAWSHLGAWISGGVAILGARWLLGRSRLPRMLNQTSTSSYLTLFLILISLIGLGSWAITARSLPDIGTRLIGMPTQFVVPLHKSIRSSSKGCRRRISGEWFRGRSPGHYCASAGQYARLPRKGPMRMSTRTSWFGVHIDRIDPADAASATPE